jgi:hypothetical protein
VFVEMSMQKIDLKLSIDSLTKIRTSLNDYVLLIDSLKDGASCLTKSRERATLAMSELMEAIKE